MFLRIQPRWRPGGLGLLHHCGCYWGRWCKASWGYALDKKLSNSPVNLWNGTFFPIILQQCHSHLINLQISHSRISNFNKYFNHRYHSCLAVKKKTPCQGTGLENRGRLNVLNDTVDTKLILSKWLRVSLMVI